MRFPEIGLLPTSGAVEERQTGVGVDTPLELAGRFYRKARESDGIQQPGPCEAPAQRQAGVGTESRFV